MPYNTLTCTMSNRKLLTTGRTEHGFSVATFPPRLLPKSKGFRLSLNVVTLVSVSTGNCVVDLQFMIFQTVLCSLPTSVLFACTTVTYLQLHVSIVTVAGSIFKNGGHVLKYPFFFIFAFIYVSSSVFPFLRIFYIGLSLQILDVQLESAKSSLTVDRWNRCRPGRCFFNL
jgi:hypothetical protein